MPPDGARGTHRRLVVVSNRLPFTAESTPAGRRWRRSPGGLVAALDPALSERGGVWVGWPGVTTEHAESAAEMMPLEAATGKVRFVPVPLSAREVSGYYSGFSNRTLWPLFHYFITRTVISAELWEVYNRVNYRFAEVVAAESDDAALIWVHDYQLLRVPRHLRHLAPTRRIGFFLHIPFPAYDVYRVLPWSRNLLRGMLSADLVGLQAPEHVAHFLNCAERLLGCGVDRDAGLVRFEGREVAVEAHPIGIEVGRFEALSQEVSRRPKDPSRIRQVLGIDRLDYTKGIPERLKAIERFLERYPEDHGRVVFIQLAVPSRTRVAEYRALKREVDEAVGRINGRFSDAGWTPIRYLFRSVPQKELVDLYYNADVALVTPLRDGMNLVAKEYVAAQGDDGGILILSELAGAAAELQEALLVNPFDPDQVADAIHRALTMSTEERRARLMALRDRVRANDVRGWAQRFIEAAEVAGSRHRAELSVVELVRDRLEPWLTGRPLIALFLDYDGTLTPIVPHPEQARLSAAAREALDDAARAPHLDVVIVSGRALEDIQRMVGVRGITYVGNHGFEIEGPGIRYLHPELRRYKAELEQAATELQELGIEGAWVERKGATVSYHTRDVLPERCRDAVRRAEAALKRHGLRAMRGKAVVDGRPPIAWDKGHAVLHVLAHRHAEDWLSRVRAVYLGDDATDEDAFRALRGIGRSLRVGPSRGTTAADLTLPDPGAVADLVRWLAAGAFLTRDT